MASHRGIIDISCKKTNDWLMKLVRKFIKIDIIPKYSYQNLLKILYQLIPKFSEIGINASNS